MDKKLEQYLFLAMTIAYVLLLISFIVKLDLQGASLLIFTIQYGWILKTKYGKGE